MSNSRSRLHWVAAILETLKSVKELILPFIFLFVANSFRGEREEISGPGALFQNWPLFIFGIIAVLTLISGVIKWLRFEYWFEDGELRIESGLFVRKKRYIPLERIQSLDYTEGIFHRLFQLVKVSVETAGSSSVTKAEAELTAITREAAKQIEEEMKAAKRKKAMEAEMTEGIFGEEELEVDIPAEPPVKPIFSMSTKDLLVLATTSGGIGVILSGAAIFLSQFSDLIPFEWVYEELEAFVRFGVVIIALFVFLAFFFVWLLSVGMTLLSYYGFQVVLEKEEDIVITRGLLEKKRITVPLKRVQNVTIVENPFRQLFGYATVIIHSAGGVGESSKINLFPLVKRKRVIEPLQELFPEMDFSEPTEKLSVQGRYFYYRLGMLIMVPAVAAASYYLFPYGFLGALIFPILWMRGRWQHRSAAFAIHRKQLTMRFREFSLHTVFVEKRRIQSMEKMQNYFHRRKGVATITVNVKSGMSVDDPSIRHMEEAQAERFMEWFEHAPRQRDVHFE